MPRYVGRLLLRALLVLLGATCLIHFILYQSGDPTFLSVGADATPQEVERIRHQLGLDRPWYLQYAAFLGGVIHGDLGTSLRQGAPVSRVVLERVPATLELALAAILISVMVGVPIGIVSATHRNSTWDQASMAIAILGQSAPTFFIGIVLLSVFGGVLNWLPIGGRGQAGPVDELRHLVLPAVTLGTFSVARNARLLRSSLLETLGLEYVLVARAKGLAERAVVLRHALRSAVIPFVTLVGLEFGTLLGGALVTETVFAWPGIGSLLVRAITQKDFPVVVGSVTLLAVVFVLVNLLVDVTYGYLDPRTRRA